MRPYGIGDLVPDVPRKDDRARCCQGSEKGEDGMSEQAQDALTGSYHMTPTDEYYLTLDAVPMVDLSIAYSPVVTSYGTLVKDIMRTHGGAYLLNFGRVINLRNELTDMSHAQVVDEVELRYMRARYIIRVHYYQLYFDCQPFTYYERDALLHDYFDGGFWQPPEALLHTLRRGWRLHLETVKRTPPPDKNTIEGQLWELGKQIAEKGVGV